MSWSGRSVRFLVVLALLFGSAAVASGPAGAAIVKPFALNYHQTVYGDFLYAGNGVLRCPVAADSAPTTGTGNTPAACANTANRADTRHHDDFFMQWADVDADPGTFDSAKATVTIPPGAKIAFARLNWAGNTGVYNLAPGVVSPTKMCQDRNGKTPAIPPPGSPAGQSVRLTVGAGKSVDVAPGSYTEDPLNTFGGGQYYSAYADVTGQFAGAPSGSPLDLTVGNVWAPKGFGCTGGWSVSLVYSYPERNPDFAPNKREVFVYDGHVRQNGTDPVAGLTIDGFRAAAADAHVGVTAYAGDWGGSGDHFLINDNRVAEPATGSTSNFFVSNADGATNPEVKNNFSVDAKSFNTGAVPAGATSAKLGFGSTGDAYLAQNIAFSTPVPELQVTTTASPPVAHAGDPVTFTIRVKNPGDAGVNDVEIVDEAFPACARRIGALAGGATTTHTCTVNAPGDDFTNTAKVTGRSALGDRLDGSSTASVDVIHPAVAITAKADKAAYRAGDTVTFTVVVTNTGDVPLTSVNVADPKAPSCARALPGSLAPGQRSTFVCTATAPIADGAATATVTGADPLGKPVNATADAPAPTIAPAIEVTKSANPPVIRAGEQVTWTITVRNTGDSPLDPVKLTDDTTSACSRAFGALAPGAAQTYTCTANPPKTTTNTVTATGTDRSGQPVTSAASTTVTVINPALTIRKDASPAVVRTGDRITFTITVTNAGDSPLSEVTVTDDHTPGCARSFGTLAPGAAQKYTCTAPAPADDFANTATATGKDQTGRELKVTADAKVDVIHPAVAVTQSAAPAQVREGDTVTFTIVVTNTGDVPLTGVTVADERVQGCAKKLETLAPQGKNTYTCTVVAGAQGFTNTAKVTGTDPTNRPVDATAEATFTVQHPAVTITKEVKGGPFRVGDAVPFQLTVKNTGDVPLTGVKVADALVASCARTFDGALPPGAIWGFGCAGKAPADDFTTVATVTGTPPVGPPVTAAGEAKVDVIHPGIAITEDVTPKVVRAGDTVTFTVTVTNAGDSPLRDVTVADPVAPDCAKRFGTLDPQAKQTYTCTLVSGVDDFAGTATATGTDGTNRPVTATGTAPVDVIHPAVAITKNAVPAQVREGDKVTFTIVVRNTGDVPLTEVSVVDDKTPSCARTFPSLVAGAEEKYTCALVAGAAGFTNTAKVTGTDPTKRPVTASGDATFTVLHPGLSIAKDVKGGPFREGDKVTFTIVVTNTGDVPLTAVKVTDDLAPSCVKTFDRLEPGAKQSYECAMTAPADDVVNVASAAGTPPTGSPVVATDDAKVDVVHPAVAITMDASPKAARAGDPVTFTVVVRNAGDAALARVSVVDELTPSCAKAFDVLDVGAVRTYQCSAIAPEDDFTSVVKVTGTPPVGPPVTATAAAKVDVFYPGIAIMKDAAPYQVREGDTVTFSILVKNIGNAPLTEVSVVDDRTPSCSRNFPALAPDAEQKFSCTTVAGAQGFTNTAKATGTDPTKRAVTASGEASFVVRHPGVTVTKTARGGPFRTGDSVPFDLVVTNTGDVELYNVKVEDDAVPECARTLGSLPVHGIQRYECTTTAPGGDVTTAAKVTAVPPIGAPVSNESTARVAVAHPAVRVTKEIEPRRVRPDERVLFTLTAANTGDVPLREVSAVDGRTPSCAFTVHTLAAGATESRTCSAFARDVTNLATVRGNDPAGRSVTGRAETAVDVAGPGLSVTATGPAKPVLPGGKATFTVVVKNTGDVPLADVTLADKATPGCAEPVGTLKPGESAKPVTCEVTMGDRDIATTVTATGRDPAGKPVDAHADAVAKVAKPGLDLVQQSDGPVRAGDPATFTLTVTNTGNADLVALELTDSTFPACDRSFARLGVGEHREWTCAATAPSAGLLTNSAIVTAEPDTAQPGAPVRDTDSATAAVIVPQPPPPAGSPGLGAPGLSPNPSPSSLPDTGYDLWPTAFTGLGLLAGGVLLLLLRPIRLARRRDRF
ncbi:DUF7507 domain-containing protein [Amycolatopsis samaneae]|uniref:DUF7507 domain-containing protein n=1 Tax=Amycolatopsis samaneae TaxID=664691 RepID=A0ABW5G9L5_9PSEU